MAAWTPCDCWLRDSLTSAAHALLPHELPCQRSRPSGGPSFTWGALALVGAEAHGWGAG
jgi:hypothetical protein